MKQQSKFSREQQETHAAERHTQSPSGREFTNADELLRFDAKQTIVPPEIVKRLKKSADEPPPAPRTTWWKRFF